MIPGFPPNPGGSRLRSSGVDPSTRFSNLSTLLMAQSEAHEHRILDGVAIETATPLRLLETEVSIERPGRRVARADLEKDAVHTVGRGRSKEAADQRGAESKSSVRGGDREVHDVHLRPLEADRDERDGAASSDVAEHEERGGNAALFFRERRGRPGRGGGRVDCLEIGDVFGPGRLERHCGIETPGRGGHLAALRLRVEQAAGEGIAQVEGEQVGGMKDRCVVRAGVGESRKMGSEAFVEAQERDPGHRTLDRGTMPGRRGTRGQSLGSSMRGEGCEHRLDRAGLVLREALARAVIDRGEDLAVEEVGDGEDALRLSAGRPGHDVRSDGSEAGLRPREAAQRGEGHAEAREGAGPDDRREQTHIGRAKGGRVESAADGGQEALRVSVIGLECPGEDRPGAPGQGEAPQGGRRVEGEDQRIGGEGVDGRH